MIEFIKDNVALSIVLLCLALGFVALLVWVIWSNKAIMLEKVKIQSKGNLKIIHISDFHNAKFKNNNEKPLSLIKESAPDLIAISGDFIDSRHTNLQRALDFATELAKIAPCFYAPGNHESRMPEEYSKLCDEFEKLGITILQDQKTSFEKDGIVYTIIGIEDPMFVIKKKDTTEKVKVIIKDKLSALIKDTTSPTIVISHRPEAFYSYVDAGANLVLTGHAHGGQAQLPLIGGLIAPNQGFFPKYSEGVHIANDTNMVISRGIGNSLCPLRFNNRPQIILVELFK